MPQCPECGGEIDDDAVVCPHCLARLKGEPAATEATAEAPRRPKARFRPVDVQPLDEMEPAARRPSRFRDEDVLSTLTGEEVSPLKKEPRRAPLRPAGPSATPTTRKKKGGWRWLFFLAAALAAFASGVVVGRRYVSGSLFLPAAPAVSETTFDRAMAMFEEGRYDVAQYLFGQAVSEELAKAEPNLAPALTMLGWSAYYAGDYTEASGLFGAAAGLAPEDYRPYLGMGMASMKLGEWDEAGDWLQQALALAPEDPQVLRAVGEQMLHKGEAENAVAYLRRASEKAPDDLEVQRLLGMALLEVEDHEGAVPALEKAASLEDVDDEVLLALYESYLTLGQHDAALRVAERLVGRRPDDPEALYRYGVALMRVDQFAEALSVFEKVAELSVLVNRAEDAYRQTGAIYSHLEKYAEAIPMLERALAINPEDVEAMTLKAWAVARLGGCADALPIFEDALSLAPANVSAQEGRKACRQWLGLE